MPHPSKPAQPDDLLAYQVELYRFLAYTHVTKGIPVEIAKETARAQAAAEVKSLRDSFERIDQNPSEIKSLVEWARKTPNPPTPKPPKTR